MDDNGGACSTTNRRRCCLGRGSDTADEAPLLAALLGHDSAAPTALHRLFISRSWTASWTNTSPAHRTRARATMSGQGHQPAHSSIPTTSTRTTLGATSFRIPPVKQTQSWITCPVTCLLRVPLVPVFGRREWCASCLGFRSWHSCSGWYGSCTPLRQRLIHHSTWHAMLMYIAAW